MSTLSTSPMSPMALPTASATLESKDIGGLMGQGFCLLQAPVVDIKPHHRVKILELCAVNQYRTLDRGKGRVSDPVLEVMDLHGLFKGLHIPLGQSGMAIVLIHMGSTVIVKRKIPLITTLVQALQG